MKDPYKDYEKDCAQIRQENAQLLDDFVALLRGQRAKKPKNSITRRVKGRLMPSIHNYLSLRSLRLNQLPNLG